MRRVTVGLAALTFLGLAACGQDPAPAETDEAPPETSAAAAGESPVAEVQDALADQIEEAPEPIAPDAPAFAVIYPGGVVDENGVRLDGSARAGGIVNFTTDAAPDEIVAFYRARAEGEGLSSVMAMNQGAARAYGAHSTVTGANLSVVASPREDEGGAAVQLVWSAGG